MARLVVTTMGSTGDLFPFLALGKGLKARGHDVALAVCPPMKKYVEAAGLTFVACGPAFYEEDARNYAEMFDGSSSLKQLRRMINGWVVPTTEASYAELLDACRGVDALISVTHQLAAPMVHEKIGVRWIGASLCAVQFPTRHEAPNPFRDLPVNFLNPLLWKVVKWGARREFLPALNAMRGRLGFKAVSHTPLMEGFAPELVLQAVSEHYSPTRDDWPSQVKNTGFWYYDADHAEWQPTAELRSFMEAGDAPLVLSLGSMVQKDPDGIVKLHVDAARAMKKRLVVQQGWALLNAAPYAGPDVIGTGFVPHDWLFARAAAVIHHGGAGTTARALKHGRAMLMETHGFDQPYNARCVRRLGVGCEIPSHKLTPKRLRAGLERVLSRDVVARAAEVGARVAAEDGVTRACEMVETAIRN